MTITMRLGLAIAAGVPVLVLVSMGPVAALVGTPSTVVWAVSAIIGLLMGLAFADLAASYPQHTGGIGVLAARVLEPRSPTLALVSRWSYWFGWTPALALNGVLVGTYVQRVLLPDAPGWTAMLFAAAILAGTVTLNHLGIRLGALIQAVLAVLVLGAVGLLVGRALAAGQFEVSRLTPFAPPGGWLSAKGIVAFGGGLFIAGWSAYGAELALSYSTEYGRGARDAVQALAIVGLLGVVAYSVVPLLLVGVVGVEQIKVDPALALTPLVRQAAGEAHGVVTAVLVIALLLGLNMITIGSSRALYQMARNGHAWTFLGQLNRNGVPANALRFDLVANLVLLGTVTVANDGQVRELPIALLAAANVGYFVSICLALVAAWLNRASPARARSPLRVRLGLLRLGVVLAVLNFALIGTAGFAWGWVNVTLGGLLLCAVLVAVRLSLGRSPGLLGTRPRPVCMAWGSGPVATLEELRTLQLWKEATPDHGRAKTGLVGADREPGAATAHRP